MTAIANASKRRPSSSDKSWTTCAKYLRRKIKLRVRQTNLDQTFNLRKLNI